MKNWWWSINIFILGSSFLACPARQPGEVQVSASQKDSVAILQDTMSKDGVVSSLDSIHPKGNVITRDSLSKDEKYSQRDRSKHEAPKHGTPNPEKMDTIKQKKKK